MQIKWLKYIAARVAYFSPLTLTKTQSLTRIYFIICIIPYSLSGCISNFNRPSIAIEEKLEKHFIQTDTFQIATWQKITNQSSPINIYIEGDGRVRKTLTKASSDPTPKNKTLLHMANIDPEDNVVYIARPCQFSPNDLNSICDSKYWTTARYSETVVSSINQVIDNVKEISNSKSINLIGYSGGGTIAILIAARREDVSSIRTIAGNLDLKEMDAYYKTPTLTESLDPISYADAVRNIPQIHFVGDKDRIVPIQVTNNFKRAANLRDSQIVIVKGADHKNGWLEKWRHLLEYVP